jgi:DNA-binding MarR family transcriptional regulator
MLDGSTVDFSTVERWTGMRAAEWESEDAVHAKHTYHVYDLLSQAFIEIDDGDRRFLRALSRQLWDREEYTLTIPHYWALVHLGLGDGRTMVDLAQLLLCDKSNVTAIVDKLEERHWVRRLRGKEGDRRFTRVVLTDEGRATRKRLIAAHDQWVQRRMSVLNAEQIDQLVSLLHILQPGLQLDPEVLAAGLAQAQGEAASDKPDSAPSEVSAQV